MEQIRGFLATDPQEPLPTLRKETRTCACGREFTAYIKAIDGKDVLDGFTLCPTCRDKIDREQILPKLTLALNETQERQFSLWLKQSNLPPLFREKTFENFERSWQPRAYDFLKSYGPETKKSIVMLSPNIYGTGKTHLIAALLHKNFLVKEKTASIVQTDSISFLDDGSFANIRKFLCPAHFAVEYALLSRIRQTFNRSNQHNDDELYEETEEDVYHDLEKFGLLVIDDVGKVRPKDTSFLQSVYFRIIDSRYTNEKPIILTTNLDFAELEAHIGGACADRLREMCGDNFVVMKGKSYRQKGG